MHCLEPQFFRIRNRRKSDQNDESRSIQNTSSREINLLKMNSDIAACAKLKRCEIPRNPYRKRNISTPIRDLVRISHLCAINNKRRTALFLIRIVQDCGARISEWTESTILCRTRAAGFSDEAPLLDLSFLSSLSFRLAFSRRSNERCVFVVSSIVLKKFVLFRKIGLYVFYIFVSKTIFKTKKNIKTFECIYVYTDKIHSLN